MCNAVTPVGCPEYVYSLMAEGGVKFMDQYRSYVINYGYGRDLVAAAVEAAGRSRAARWSRFRLCISFSAQRRIIWAGEGK